MIKKLLTTIVVAGILLPGIAAADELTQIVQQDLAALGYDPGNTDGEVTVTTVVAISKFQAEHDLEVTGEATPQLAGIIKAALSQGGQAAAAPASAAQAPAPAPAQTAALAARDPLELQAAQQACLQQKMADAQESSQRKRGFARLARAVSRTASRLGSDGISQEITDLSRNVYDVDAIAGDLKGAAEDLGLTENDIEECRNPS